MKMRRWVLAIAVLAVMPAFAGCAEDTSSASDEPIQRGGSVGGQTTNSGGFTPVVSRPPSARWHFHDAWQGQPTITLLDANITLEARTNDDGIPVVGAIVEFPTGVSVPPETGVITVNVSWASAGGAVNLTYRPADANFFLPAADIPNEGGVAISTTESNADVPHRAQSLWAFNLTAVAAGTPPALPDRAVHIIITATIGRPLFIDPPHLDWWQGGDVIPLVLDAKGEIKTLSTPAGPATMTGLPGGAPKPGDIARVATVPADQGRIVPEGAKSLVILLNWTSDLPDNRLIVRYREANMPSEGPLDIIVDSPSHRVFTLKIDPDQTDTTYSNRTTWAFDVLPEKDPGAFAGTFTMYAWVTRLSPDLAVAETLGTT